MTLSPERENRLQTVMAEINNGIRDIPAPAEIKQTFDTLTERLNMASVLLTGDMEDLSCKEPLDFDDKYFEYFPNTPAKDAIPSTDPADNVIDTLERDIHSCWNMMEVFMRSRDARGIHNTSIEIQTLERTLTEIKKLRGIK